MKLLDHAQPDLLAHAVLLKVEEQLGQTRDRPRLIELANLPRGLRPPLLVISDGGAGLIAAVEVVLSASLRPGTGKTTLLGVLSSFIPPGERLITIEDAAERRVGGGRHHARASRRGRSRCTGTAPGSLVTWELKGRKPTT